MPVSPEVKINPEEVKNAVEFIPDTPQIPEHIEKGGINPVQTQFTAQVAGDNNQPLIQSPASPVTITLPGDPEKFEVFSKGEPTKAITWLALFWLRMLKKAAHFGWKVVSK